MKKSSLKKLAVFVGFVLAWLLPAQADTLNNTFDTPFDYVTSGIIGDTNWDGVYLDYGDIPGGSGVDNGNGSTPIAGTATYAGFLGVRNIGGDWANQEDDGFFLYKVVNGDFDVSVESSPYTLDGGTWFDNRGYQMAGLMVRAYNPNNSGAPYSTTSANAVENYVMLLRFQEWDIDEINESVNGVRAEHVFGDLAANGTNASRFFRIVRTAETNFTFYWKTNLSDSWAQITSDLPGGVLTRSDLTGPLQVGIAECAFSTESRDAVFDNFELSGTNVSFPTMPAAPTGLVTTATNILGALTFSWTANGGDGSLVVMSPRPIQHNPVQGIVYSASSVYGNANALLGGAGEFVVYSGPATSVTVTNLGANNLTYYVAVFSYSTASPPVYNTASPVTGTFAGPGVITGASLQVATTNIPVGGAVALKLVGSFSTGETSDQSASATWSSSDASIAAVDTAGTVSGLANGEATITATFGSFTPSTKIMVHSPAFTDNFAVTQNYVVNGLQGSAWDRLYLNYGDVPGADKGQDAVAGQTFQLIANTNALYLQAAGGTWRYIGSDGTFLNRIVTGDFQASVHVTCGTINNNYAGIMARLYAAGGAGGGSGGTETHINWGNPQQGTASARLTVDSGGTTTVAGLTTDRWLLMQRVNSTNFYFFEKSSSNSLWTAVSAATMVISEAVSNAPMEVGLFEEMRSAATDWAQFDTLMIDGPGIVSAAGTPPPPPANNLTATLNPDLSMTFSWVSVDATNGPVTSILVMRAGGPVTAQPTYGLAPGWPSGVFGTGLDLGGGNYVVYRSTGSPTTVTVTGLTPGTTYYAAVYTFAGTYPDRVYNSVLPATGATASQLDGTLESVLMPPLMSIPLGGLQVASVFGVYGGVPVNVSAFATITVANTNVVQLADGAFTGIALGSTTAEVIFGGMINTMSLTVRAPTFTDNFGVNQNYLASGVAGSPWDGVYRQGVGINEIPGSEYVPDPTLGTAVADANITSNNVLTISAASPGWENADAGGFFLFKYVPGDFQMAVHINSYDVAGYNQPGLLARAYSNGTNGTTPGAPFVIGPARTNYIGGDPNQPLVISTYGESWISLTRFDEYDIGTYARLTLDSITQQTTQTDQDDGNFWLLIQRNNGTDFKFYKRASTTEPWRLLPNKTAYHQAEFAGAPMQVGLMAGPWHWTAGENRTVMFEQFMLDVTPPGFQITRSGSNAIVSWPNVPGVILKSTVNLAPTAWQPVSGTVTTNGETLSITVPMTNTATFFRLFY